MGNKSMKYLLFCFGYLHCVFLSHKVVCFVNRTRKDLSTTLRKTHKQNFSSLKVSFFDGLDSPSGTDSSTSTQGQKPRKLDWREFRARLVAGDPLSVFERKLTVSRRLLKLSAGNVWAHETSVVEPGTLLVSTDPKKRFVFAIIGYHHTANSRNSNGNPTSVNGFLVGESFCKIKETFPDFPPEMSEIVLNYGGTEGSYKLYLTHTDPNLKAASSIFPGFYIGGEIEEAANRIRLGKSTVDNYHFFVQHTSWSLSDVLSGVENKLWKLIAVSPSFLSYLFLKGSSGWDDVEKVVQIFKIKTTKSS